jgi:hypothetical protein
MQDTRSLLRLQPRHNPHPPSYYDDRLIIKVRGMIKRPRTMRQHPLEAMMQDTRSLLRLQPRHSSSSVR